MGICLRSPRRPDHDQLQHWNGGGGDYRWKPTIARRKLRCAELDESAADSCHYDAPVISRVSWFSVQTAKSPPLIRDRLHKGRKNEEFRRLRWRACLRG